MVESAHYTASGSIIAVIDGVEMSVPDDMSNRHRRMLAEWEAQGNKIEPYAPPPPTLNDYERAIQALIDATAREKKYEDGKSCATYVNSTNPQWAAEAAAFVAWRDAVWVYAFTELDKVLNGQRQQPTVGEFLLELPAIEWPNSIAPEDET